MTYSYRLLIDSVDYSDIAEFNSISINYGRSDLSSQPQPATFNGTITIKTGELMSPIRLDGIVQFQILNSNWVPADYYNLFTGYVSDVTASVGTYGDGVGLVNYQILALGHLSRYNRKNVGTTGFIKKYDSERIEDIALDSGGIIPITYSDPVGTYEIAAVSNGNYDALQLMQDTANSAMGVLCDTPDPDEPGLEPMTYVTYLDRSYLPTHSLTTDDVIAGGLTVSKSLTKIVNKAWLTYGSSGSTVSTIYTDPLSPFDELAGSRTTYIHNSTDANSIAQILLAARTQELYELTSVSINLAFLDETVIDDMITIRNGHGLTINGLPFDDVTNFNGFIEGWTWQINKNGTTLTLNLSNYGQNYPYTLWNQLGATDTWNTIYTATTTWEDIS